MNRLSGSVLGWPGYVRCGCCDLGYRDHATRSTIFPPTRQASTRIADFRCEARFHPRVARQRGLPAPRASEHRAPYAPARPRQHICEAQRIHAACVLWRAV
eukprot:6102877-Prymnesium_polylepis.3